MHKPRISNLRKWVQSLFIVKQGLAEIEEETIGVGDYAGWNSVKLLDIEKGNRMRISRFDGRYYVEVRPSKDLGKEVYTPWFPADPKQDPECPHCHCGEWDCPTPISQCYNCLDYRGM